MKDRNQPEIISPCEKDCRVDGRGYCLTCRRSLKEIEQWGQLTEAERERIMSELPNRKL